MRHALTSCLLCLLLVASVAAQDPPAAQTAQDPKIDLKDLDASLLPLTRDQLTVEADAWLALVQATCQEIAGREIGARAAQDDAERSRLLGEIGPLTEQRTTRIDRLLEVVDAFVAKGGADDEAEVYRQYAGAVGGINLDVTDTSAAWTAIVHWVQSPEGGIRIAWNILFFVLTLLAFRILSRVVGRVVARSLRSFGKTSDLLRDFFVGTTRKLVFFIGIVLALSMLEVDIGPFLAAMGAAGFVIGFALQGTLSNFASGIMILLYRPYDIGDYVQVAGVAGTVEAMNLVSTTVKSPDNQTIVVPNGSIWGGVINNITGADIRRVDLTVGVGYSDDLGKAEGILAEILEAHPLVLADPEPVIKVHELADSSVNFVVRPWSKTSDYWAVYWDVTRAVKDRFDAEGVSIPFPQRDVHVHQLPQS